MSEPTAELSPVDIQRGFQRHSPASWAEAVTAGSKNPYQRPRHVMAIDQTVLDHIQGRTGTDILIVEAPPRHGKSETISKWTPAWFLGRYPDLNVGVVSHAASIANSWGRKARDILRHNGPSWWDVRVSQDKHAATEWYTDQGGSMRTAGVGGQLTGFGFHLLIVDDFLKNAEKALSAAIRQGQWDWWQSTVTNRLEPGGKIIIMATRWHVDDLIGRTLRQAQETGIPVAELKLPAIAEDDDPIGREPGEALWPERWPAEKLERRERSLERFWWLSQYQQRPSQHTATEWPDEYFEGIMAEPGEWPDRFELTAVGVDPSKGQTTKPGDYFASVFGGLAGGIIWVDAKLERQKDVSHIVAGCCQWVHDCDHPVDGIALESNMFQSLLEPEFDRQCAELNLPPLPIHLVNETGNKGLRISALGPYLRRKKLRFRDTPGTRLLLQQLKDHPMAEHDDGPDALEKMLKLLRWLGANANEFQDEAAVDLQSL